MACLAVSALLIIENLGLSVSPWAFLPAVALLLLCQPFWHQMVHGQLNLLLLLVFAGVWAADRHGHSRWAGALLGMATAIKKVPALISSCQLISPLRLRGSFQGATLQPEGRSSATLVSSQLSQPRNGPRKAATVAGAWPSPLPLFSGGDPFVANCSYQAANRVSAGKTPPPGSGAIAQPRDYKPCRTKKHALLLVDTNRMVVPNREV